MIRFERLVCSVLLAGIVGPGPRALVGAEVSHEKVELYGELIEAGRQAVVDDYAMLHMRFRVKEEDRRSSEPTLTVYRYEFWAMGDTHFRIDSECVEATDESLIGQRYRFIVNDAAYAALFSPRADADFSVTDFGDAELGRGLVRGKAFFMAQVKLFNNLHMRTGFPRISERRKDYSLTTEYLRDDSDTGRLSFSYTYSVPVQEYKQHVEGVLDARNAYVILQATSRSETAGSVAFSKMNCSYDVARFGTIPVRVVMKTGNVEHLESSFSTLETIETEHVDHTPIPLDVFELPVGVDAAP